MDASETLSMEHAEEQIYDLPVMYRTNSLSGGLHDRRSMFELHSSSQPLWQPSYPRSYQGSVDNLTQLPSGNLTPINPIVSQSTNDLLQPYQALPGNRHSYSGGSVHFPQQPAFGVIAEEEPLEAQPSPPVVFRQYPASPADTAHRRASLQHQRSYDSASSAAAALTAGKCHPHIRRAHTRSVILQSVSESEDGMATRKYDLVEQGPEMSDSITSASPGSNAGTSPSTPQLTPKHRGGNMQAAPGSAMLQPVPGQVFIDPATGQHYIIPQAAPMNPYMNPYLYGAPAGAPPGGYYYPPPPMPGYAVPYGQFSSRFASPSFGRPGGLQQTSVSTDDVRDDATHPPQSPLLGKGTTSFAAGYHASQKRDERPSPPNSQPEDPESGRDPFRRDVTRSSAEFGHAASDFTRSSQPTQQQQQHRIPQGYGMHSAAPGSAPVLQHLDQSQSLWWSRQRAPPGHAGFLGDTAASDIEPSTRQCLTGTLSAQSDTESAPLQPYSRGSFSGPSVPQPPAMAITTFAAAQQEPAPPVPKPKAIRMEIDLGKPMPEEEELKKQEEEERTRVKAARAAPTAFTVSFGGEGASTASEDVARPKPPISLQDAARRGRMARRSVQQQQQTPISARATQSARGAATTQSAVARGQSEDDKDFLLGRLLHGDKARPATADAPSSSGSEQRQHADADNSSEAGTYVIGTNESRQHSAMITSQIVEDSDASSTATETSESRSPSPKARRPVGGPAAVGSNRAGEEGARRMLLSELAKLKEARNVSPAVSPRCSGGASASHATSSHAFSGPSATSSSTAPKARQTLMNTTTNRSVFGMAACSAGLRAPLHSPTVTPSSSSNTPTTTPTPTTTVTNHAAPTASSNFRRADGGRFSMRSGANAPVATPPAPGGSQRAPKPPFKLGGRPLVGSATVEKQREKEMTAWLRRRDYDPMKAAAEARKQKNRADTYVQNRSISFHVGPTGAQGKALHPLAMAEPLARNKSSESLVQAEEDIMSHASQKVIAEYSRGVVQDINKLTKQHSRAKDKKELTGLARVVDQLSNKCVKSIELIRSQNKGCLSVSVEDLLATAVEPPRADEDLTDRLDRLSQAFDAVQRYLEQYSLEDKFDVSSEEEGCSSFSSSGGTHHHHRPAPSTFSSFSGYRGSGGGASGRPLGSNRSTVSAAPVARPARTTAFRAKLLGTKDRSPSGGRPAKNN